MYNYVYITKILLTVVLKIILCVVERSLKEILLAISLRILMFVYSVLLTTSATTVQKG